MAINTDTYIESLNITLEDLYEMTDAEREAFYESVMADLDDTAAEELRQEIADEMSAMGEELYVLQSELEDILDSNDSSTEEKARAEYYLEDIDAMLSLTDEFGSEWGAAATSMAAHSVDKTDGTDYTFDAASDVAQGEEFVIDCTGTTDEPEMLFDDPHANDSGTWVDTDGDGYTDTQADTDDDGIADVDTNGDGVITEADMTGKSTTTTTQTVTIKLDEGDTIKLADYDSATGETRWAVTTEDGITYYLTIKGTPDIRFNGTGYNFDSTDIEHTWAPELLNRVYENSTTSTSFGELLGVSDSESTGSEYYTIVDMSKKDNNTTTVAVTSTDIENGRNYTIDMENNTPDTLTLDIPDNVEMSFSVKDGGETIVITLTDASGNTSTITINNFQWGDMTDDSDDCDLLQINGGNLDEDDCKDLAKYIEDDAGNKYYLTDYIYKDGDSIEDIIDDENYSITHTKILEVLGPTDMETMPFDPSFGGGRFSIP